MMRVLTLIAVALTLSPLVHAADVDPYLPDDTTLVGTLNVKQALESPLGKKHLLPLIQQQLKSNAELTKGLTALGFDPLTDFDSVTIATSGVDSLDAKTEVGKLVVIAHGTFDLNKVHAAADAVMKQNPQGLKMSTEGSMRIYESQTEKQTAYFAFVDKNTIFAAGSRTSVVKAVKNGVKPPKLNKDMAALIAKIDGTQTGWMAALIPPEAKKQLALLPQTMDIAEKLYSVSGGMTLKKDFVGGLAIHTADAKTAEAISAYLDALKATGKFALTSDKTVAQQLGQDVFKALTDLVDGVEIGTSKASATINVRVTEDMILKFVKAAESRKP
jgi:hypothetical protein